MSVLMICENLSLLSFSPFKSMLFLYSVKLFARCTSRVSYLFPLFKFHAISHFQSRSLSECTWYDAWTFPIFSFVHTISSYSFFLIHFILAISISFLSLPPTISSNLFTLFPSFPLFSCKTISFSLIFWHLSYQRRGHWEHIALKNLPHKMRFS